MNQGLVNYRVLQGNSSQTVLYEQAEFVTQMAIQTKMAM